MSKAPAMPMYWDAYLADTTHLTTEEHGAYLLLLGAMWRRNGRVPDDDKDNARILGLTPAKWRKIKARFLETISGFEVRDGVITQEKLKKTWENTQEKIEKNRSNGAKGGRPNTRKNNNLEKANGSVSDNPNESIPEPEPEPENRDTDVSLSVVHLPPTKAGSPKQARAPDRFDEFWERYPRKKGKGDARKAYAKAMKKVRHDDVMFALSQQLPAMEAKEAQYRPHPSTWLNQERWNDEPDDPASDPARSGPGGSRSGMADAFAAVAARHAAGDRDR